MTTRLQWEDLTEDVRETIWAQTGPVFTAEPISAGYNSEIAVIVHTEQARTFVKGLRIEHPRVWTQRREQEINPHVAGIAPRLRWQIETGGWNLLGFEVIDGRPMDYSPGSADLPKLRDTLGRLGQIPCPDLPLKHAEQRWSAFSDSPGLFAGAALLHTELSPGNVLITETCAHLVDWAWPTRGASWIDPACAVVWLIAFGHTPADAERWAEQLPAWHTATPTHLAAFAQTQHTMWASIAADHPDAWIRRVAQGAQRWAEHRG